MAKVTVRRSEPVVEAVELSLSVDEAAYVYACLGQFASWKLRGEEPGFDVYHRIGLALRDTSSAVKLDGASRRLKDIYTVTDKTAGRRR